MNIDIGLFTGQVPPESDTSPTERYQAMVELGEVADQAGFEKAWVSEHHFLDDSYIPAVQSFASALGARTSSMTIGTGIALAPFYDPIRLAESSAVIDRLTAGRYELGLAIGWTDEEFEAFDIDKRKRVAHTKDRIEIARKAWNQDTFSHDGRLYDYSDVSVYPKPDSRIPIWIGGTVDAAVKRAATMADGYFATPTPLDELERRQELLAETETDPTELAEWRYTFVAEDEDPWDDVKQNIWYIKRQYIEWATGEPQPYELPEEQEDDLRDECLVGSVSEVTDRLHRRRDRLGEDYRFVARMTLPGLSAAKIENAVELFGDEIIPELR
ncbi:LLM class flavin-dependent oxidoreductase [Natrinema halophilum]|uniref:LLM class flavin-dependent oxidoreductase n=1 Tax=Natrinema halophilum TaxID=1699371 RepID=A0A7D5KX47_9EURY|nr:LLM class flavin-dependent oxidoreductase [Natrinema halophilum]QLG48502.1 LLM class flavin-dependent oxidoreductase [Natrinema halophilum]